MKRITHICMDRPPPADAAKDKSKEYIQPQYIVDSVNNLFLLPTKPYLPGIAAPAHLSPFIDNEAEGYLPDRQREINSLAGIESNVAAGPTIGGDDDSESGDDKKQEEEAPAKQQGTKRDVDSSSDEGTSEELSDSEDEAEEAPKTSKKGPGAKSAPVDKAPAKAKNSKQIQKKVLTKADK